MNGIRDRGPAVLNWTPERSVPSASTPSCGEMAAEYDWPAVDEASLLATGKLVAAA